MIEKLKNIFLFKDVDDDTLKEIAHFSKIINLKKDNILFYEGEKSKDMHFLYKGIIKLYKTSSNNKEIIIKYFTSNELIAEIANYENIPYPASAEAFTNVEIIKINFKKLEKIIFSNVKISYQIQKSLIKKIRTLENVISSYLVLDSKERLAKYIYEHSEDFFHTKHILIAQILNMSPETLSRILRVFKDNKIIDMENKTINKDALYNNFT